MKITLSARGSLGDTLPMVVLAARLQARGHRVTVCVPEPLRELAEARGLETRTYPEDSHAVMASFESGWRAAVRSLEWFGSRLDEHLSILVSAAQGSQALVSTVNELAAPTAAELVGARYFRLAYAPVLPGSQSPPLLPHQGLPPWANRMLWRFLNRGLDLAFKDRVDRLRRRHGLAPTSSLAHHLAHSGTTLLAFSPLLAPPSDDWSAPHAYVGPCLGQVAPEADLSPRLREFLDTGPPPVYFGLGSVAVDRPEELSRLVLAAARKAGCRLVLARGWAGLGGSAPSDPNVFLADLEPHGPLFERVAGVCHHGGSGTVHRAALAGVPQFILPQIADQFYWGHRIWRLGLGPKPVPPNRLTLEDLVRSFRDLSSGRYQARAADLAPFVAPVPGEDRAAAMLESLLGSDRDARRRPGGAPHGRDDPSGPIRPGDGTMVRSLDAIRRV